MLLHTYYTYQFVDSFGLLRVNTAVWEKTMAIANPEIELTLRDQKEFRFVDRELQELQIGSLENADDIKRAVDDIRSGGIVAAQFRNVFGFWFNGWINETANKALKIKGTVKYATKPLSTMMFSENFLPLVDSDLLSPEVKVLVEDPDTFQKRFGSLCHMRAPIRKELIDHIPPRILSWQHDTPYMHNLDPHGHEPMASFIKNLNDAGQLFLGMTAVGKHKKPEFTSKYGVIELSKKSEMVNLLLEDPWNTHPDVKGSFPVVDLEKKKLLREGHIPTEIIQQLFGFELLTDDNIIPSHFELANIFTDISLDGSTPEKIRSLMIDIIHSLQE